MQTQINFNSNSLFAYREVLDTLSQRQELVLNGIRYLNEATCSEVATHLKVFPHTISGRFGELKEKNLIECVGNKIIGNRPHAIWKVTI